MSKTIGWAATSATEPLSRYVFDRREPRPTDVVIDVLFCGVCHSDIHTARNEWPWSRYPVVPGHEIIGRVSRVGGDVTKFREGDVVGVGCMVDSCGDCDECRADLEQYCVKGCTWTYGSDDLDGGLTQGGYSASIVVRQEFVLRIPPALDPASAAPLLCAGITMYSPLRYFEVGSGTRVGIAGLGGLGVMGVKLGVALGADVTVFTTSPHKGDIARALGASGVVDVADEESMNGVARSFDVIVSTIPRTHDVSPYLMTLRRDGVYVIVGALEPMLDPYDANVLTGRRASITGSGIGGIRETQELLDYCAERQIVSDVERVRIEDINDVYEQIVLKQPARRFVIDMASLC